MSTCHVDNAKKRSASSSAPAVAVILLACALRLAGADAGDAPVLTSSWTSGFGEITTASFVPGRHDFVIGSEIGTSWLIDPEAARIAQRFEGQPDSVDCLAFTPDGRWMASASSVCVHSSVIGYSRYETTVYIHDLATGDLRQLCGHEWGLVTSLAFSPNGAYLAVGDNDVVVCDAESGEVLWTLPAHAAGTDFPALCFADTSDILAVLARGRDGCTAELWNVSSGHCTFQTTLEGSFTEALALHTRAEQTILVVGCDTQVEIWSVEDEARMLLIDMESLVLDVAIAPNGESFAVTTIDGGISLLEIVSGNRFHILEDDPDTDWRDWGVIDFFDWETIDFSCDGTLLLAASPQGRVWIWSLEHDSYKLPLWKDLALRPYAPITSVMYNATGTGFAAGDLEGGIRFWEKADSGLPWLVSVHTNAHAESVDWLFCSSDGVMFASGSAEGTACLWDVTHPETPKLFRALASSVPSHLGIPISPDLSILTMFEEPDTLLAASLFVNEPPRIVWEGGGRYISAFAWSPKATYLVVGLEDGGVVLVDGASGTERWTSSLHSDLISSLTFSPDETLVATGSYDLSAMVWDVDTGQLRCFFPTRSVVESVSFDHEGARVACGLSNARIDIWDVALGTQLCQLRGHDTRVTSVMFSPDGSWVLSGSEDGTVKLWDLRTLPDEDESP